MNRQEKAALARISRNKKALPFGTLNRPAAQSAVDNMSQSPVESISAQTGLPASHHPTGEPSHPKDSGFGRVRPLHGYWDSPEISSAFPWRINRHTADKLKKHFLSFSAEKIAEGELFRRPEMRRASRRRSTGYSFVTHIIPCCIGLRQSFHECGFLLQFRENAV